MEGRVVTLLFLYGACRSALQAGLFSATLRRKARCLK